MTEKTAADLKREDEAWRASVKGHVLKLTSRGRARGLDASEVDALLCGLFLLGWIAPELKGTFFPPYERPSDAGR